jgi:hypothetical protein
VWREKVQDKRPREVADRYYKERSQTVLCCTNMPVSVAADRYLVRNCNHQDEERTWEAHHCIQVAVMRYGLPEDKKWTQRSLTHAMEDRRPSLHPLSPLPSTPGHSHTNHPHTLPFSLFGSVHMLLHIGILRWHNVRPYRSHKRPTLRHIINSQFLAS